MIELRDLNKVSTVNSYYAGNAGIKQGILLDSEVWIVKFPQSTKALSKPQLSYTTSPLSEYLGSHIYASFGIPVHETLLGIKDGKVVVACKDFRAKGDEFADFKSIKNSYLPSDGRDGTSGSGNGTMLSDVLDTIHNEPLLSSMPDVETRFWDMFLIDYLIGNNDRNNTNWGVIFDIDRRVKSLAPVFDNGNAFFGKRSDSLLAQRHDSREAVLEDALFAFTNVYLDEEGHHLHPHQLLKEGSYPGLTTAVKRTIEQFDFERIEALLADIPEEYEGYPVMSDIRKQFYLAVMKARYTESILPAA